MRKLLLAILVFIALTSIANSDQLSPADLKGLLAKLRERRASAPDVQADFHEEKNIRLMNKPIVSTGKVWFEAPNKFRREVKGNSPSVTVSNGRDLWIYYANFKSAEHYTLGKRSPVDAAIAAINTALNLESENDFRITGSKTPQSSYELELVPRSPSLKRMFQKFELRLNSDLLAERTEMSQQNGDRIVTTYSNQSRAPIPKSTFEFTPLAGTEVTTPLGR